MTTQQQHGEITDDSLACLACGKTGEQLRRGLCEKDYFRFRRRLTEFPVRERDAFEKSLIADGLLLPVGKKKAAGDVFAEAAARFRSRAERELAEADTGELTASDREALRQAIGPQADHPAEQPPPPSGPIKPPGKPASPPDSTPPKRRKPKT